MSLIDFNAPETLAVINEELQEFLPKGVMVSGTTLSHNNGTLTLALKPATVVFKGNVFNGESRETGEALSDIERGIRKKFALYPTGIQEDTVSCQLDIDEQRVFRLAGIQIFGEGIGLFSESISKTLSVQAYRRISTDTNVFMENTGLWTCDPGGH